MKSECPFKVGDIITPKSPQEERRNDGKYQLAVGERHIVRGTKDEVGRWRIYLEGHDGWWWDWRWKLVSECLKCIHQCKMDKRCEFYEE